MGDVTRLLPDAREDLAAYRARGGYTALAELASQPQALREILSRWPLTGLGGAHYPFSAKVTSALDTPGPRMVVCNAAEDEPGSLKDRVLVEVAPHTVIEGALLAAVAVEADELVFYVRETLPDAISSLTLALAEMELESLWPQFRIRISSAPTTYVAGEASAAIASIEGGEAKPRTQPPYPTESGVDGRPTLVSNVETLANLPRMVAAEAPAGRTLTRLATVTGDVTDSGVFEIDPSTTTFDELLQLAGGLPSGRTLKAFQPGGPSSAFLPAVLSGTLMSNDAIRGAGSEPGCLAVRVLADDRCLVEEVAQIAAFFAREQCGQCPGCRMKTTTYSTILAKVRDSAGSWDLLGQFATIDEFVSDMPRRCGLIDMPTPPVTSSVQHFRDDFAAHIERGACEGSHAPPSTLTNERHPS